ncbi:hypothetical protein BX600DRAFT_434157 [Xylariales sp. PMI_506]|nr:hypothetical protein BX600DRAFT_434157 [Xylariales sp. PMI_506]
MDEYDVLLDLPSPAPHPYMYQDAESLIESSASTSPMGSPVWEYPLPLQPYYDMSTHGLPPSPDLTDGLGDFHQSEGSPDAPSKPKRKRENRYKNAPPSVLSRRRAQNRASQRAYRERKDQRIKDLEILLGEAQQKNDVLNQAYAALQAEYVKLKSEQDSIHHYQSVGLNYDPTIGTAGAIDGVDMDLYLYHDTTGYTMG